MTNRCWVSLVYDWGEASVPLCATEVSRLERPLESPVVIEVVDAAS